MPYKDLNDLSRRVADSSRVAIVLSVISCVTSAIALILKILELM